MERIHGKIWNRVVLLECAHFSFDRLKSAVERAATIAHPEVRVQQGYDWEHELHVSACAEPSADEVRMFEVYERGLAEETRRRELETLKNLKVKHGDAEEQP